MGPRYVLSSEFVPGTGHDMVNEFLRKTDVVFSDVFPCVAVPPVMPVGVAVWSEKAHPRLERVLIDARRHYVGFGDFQICDNLGGYCITFLDPIVYALGPKAQLLERGEAGLSSALFDELPRPYVLFHTHLMIWNVHHHRIAVRLGPVDG